MNCKLMQMTRFCLCLKQYFCLFEIYLLIEKHTLNLFDNKIPEKNQNILMIEQFDTLFHWKIYAHRNLQSEVKQGVKSFNIIFDVLQRHGKRMDVRRIHCSKTSIKSCEQSNMSVVISRNCWILIASQKLFALFRHLKFTRKTHEYKS